MAAAWGRIGFLALAAPLIMGISDCSGKVPDMGAKPSPKPRPTGSPTGLPTGGPIAPPTPVQSGSCDRVEYDKIVVEPCLLPGGGSGTSNWKMHCYSDGYLDPASGQCASNGQQEYCNPNPVSYTACTGGPATTAPETPGDPGPPVRTD